MDTSQVLPTPALDKYLKLEHRKTCTYWVFSGDRHCSCGRDKARAELDLLLSGLAAQQEALPLFIHTSTGEKIIEFPY